MGFFFVGLIIQFQIIQENTVRLENRVKKKKGKGGGGGGEKAHISKHSSPLYEDVKIIISHFEIVWIIMQIGSVLFSR